MILNNTQANIFKVNGGIADDFANRPAANGSFYIFYSIDTQEIFYDNGAWVLLGSGGGGGVNIYNTDGTLTGNRTLSGANNDLNFADLNIFKTSVGGIDIGLTLDFANNFFGIGNNFQDIFFYIDNNFKTIISNYNGNVEGLKFDLIQRTYEFGNLDLNFNRTIFIIDDNNQIIKTKNQGNEIGLKLDFANTTYQLGDYLGIYNGSYIGINDNSRIIALQAGSNFNNTTLVLNDTNQLIATSVGGNDIGLKLDFANQQYILGNQINQHFIFVDEQNVINQIVSLDTNVLSANNGTISTSFFQNTNLIKSIFQSNDIGIKLDFANTIYQFGQITGGASNNQLIINDANYWFYTSLNGQNRGLFFQVSPGSRTYNFGELTANNRTQITIDDILETTTFIHAGVQKGLKLDYAQRRYQFGQLSANNLTSFNIEDNGGFIYCLYQNNGIGFSFQSNINNYQYGQISGGNLSKLIINDLTNQIYLSNANVFNGWFCDFNTKIYRFGQINGGNLTRYVIDDNNTYPLGVEGNNITSGTSGGSSGQHLKIKINGVDYKIKLENP